LALTFDLDFETEFARRFVQLSQLIVEEGVARVEQHADLSGVGDKFVSRS
jgi:hypothetical protein